MKNIKKITILMWTTNRNKNCELDYKKANKQSWWFTELKYKRTTTTTIPSRKSRLKGSKLYYGKDRKKEIAKWHNKTEVYWLM